MLVIAPYNITRLKLNIVKSSSMMRYELFLAGFDVKIKRNIMTDLKGYS